MPSLKNLEKPTSKKIAHGKITVPSKNQKKVKAALKLKNEEAKQKDLKKGKAKTQIKKVIAAKVKASKSMNPKLKEKKMKEVDESVQIELPLEMPDNEANTQTQFHASHEEITNTEAHPLATEADVTSKVSFQFYGSDALREKLPQAFEFAEQVATDWVQDGEFEGLPFKNPLAQFFVAKSLRKAKDTEKQILEKIETHPVLSKAKTGLVEKAQMASATLKLLLKK